MMRRSTLSTMSSAQVNSRGNNNVNATARSGTKQARPSMNIPAAPKSHRSSQSRRSSLHGKGGQIETRPINDKGFQQDCIRTILNYLPSHGYNNAVSQKTLQAPSSKDVVSIIHFLFLQLDPNFEFKKIEEDVPLIFKRLGYPVQISRSAIYAAGSPVSWPSLLAALAWLANLLNAVEGPGEGEQGDSPFFDQLNDPFSEYVNKGYELFMHGEDAQAEQLDEEYRNAVREENDKLATEVILAQEYADELRERLRKLKSEQSPLATLEAKKFDYQEDIGKLNMVITNFLSHKEALEKKRDEKRQELATKKEEAVSILKENEELRERIGAQQVNAADVDKMLREKEILEVNLQSLLSRKQELEKSAWDFEIQSSKKIRDLEGLVNHFNEGCERLKPISGEESLDHSPFQIKLQPRADDPAEILGGTIKTIIKPGLADLTEKTKRILTEEIKPEEQSLQELLFKRQLATREKMAQKSKALAHTKKLESQFKTMEGKPDAHLNSIMAELDEVESRMVEQEFSLQKEEMEEADVQLQLRETQAEYERAMVMCNDEIEHARAEGTEILDIILSTKERTQASLKRVEDCAVQTIETLREHLIALEEDRVEGIVMHPLSFGQ